MNAFLESLHRHRRFLAYCVIGGCGVTFDFAVYWTALQSSLATYQQANTSGYFVGTILSFLLNSRFNFRVTDNLLARFVAFLGVAAVGFVVSAVMLHVLIEYAGIGQYLAKASVLMVVVMIQYNLNRVISFRQPQ